MRLPLLDKLMQGPERRFSERAGRLLDKGKVDQAADLLRSGLEKLPQSVDLHVALIRLLMQAGHHPESHVEVGRLLTGKPASLGEVSRLVEMCRRRRYPTAGLHHTLAQHHIRRSELAHAAAQLEHIESRPRSEYCEQSECCFLDQRDDPASTAAAVEAGLYAALAREVMGEDRVALDRYRDVLHLDPDQFPHLQPRLQGLAQRNAGDSALRLSLVTLHLAHADEITAARDAMDLLEHRQDVAAPLAARLAERNARNPEEDEIVLGLARARWVEGQVHEALEQLAPLAARGRQRAALESLLSGWRLERSDLPRSTVLLADVLGHQGKGEEAIQTLSEMVQCTPRRHLEGPLGRLLQRYPDEPRGYLQLAWLHQMDGEGEACMHALEQHLQRAPEQRAEAIPVLWALLEGQPSHAAAHLMLAKNLLEVGQLDSAVTLLRHLIQQLPEDAGQLRDSLESLASSNPGHSGVRLAVAEACIVSEEPRQALPHLQAALEDPARAPEVAHRLSVILERWPDEALQVEDLVHELQGRLADPAAQPYLQAQWHAAQGQVQEAVQVLGDCYAQAPAHTAVPVRKLLEQLLAAHPGAAAARQLLAQVLAESGEAPRAVSLVLDTPDPEPEMIQLLLQRLEAMAGQEGGDVMVHCSLARVLLFVGHAAQALEAVEVAVADSAGTASGTLYQVRGDALLAMERSSDAVKSWQQAVALEPSLAESVVQRLQRLYEADPDHAEAQLVLGRLLADSGSMERGIDLLVDLAARRPDWDRRAFTQMEALAASHAADHRPALAAAHILSATGELATCAGWAARSLQRGAPDAMVDQFLGDLMGEHPGQPDLLRCQALARVRHRPEDSCRLLAESAQGGSLQASRALEVLQRVSARHPRLATPGLVACRIHLDLEDHQAAFQDLKIALHQEQPCEEALELLARIQELVPGEPQVHIAMARCLLLHGRGSEALASVQHAVDASAAAESLDLLLQELVTAEVPGALLERARIHLRRGHLPQALADLEDAAEQGLQLHVLETLGDLLGQHPEDLEARRLQLRLLQASGDLEATLQCLNQVLQTERDTKLRLDWLLRRADVRRDAGDACGAGEDLEEARLLAPDPDVFLQRVHQRRAHRLAGQLADAVGAERVHLLLELGRWEEAARYLAGERRDQTGMRELRASLLLARGDAAAALRLLHPGAARHRMVDAAQRCDRPEIALAGMDRLLEEREDAALRQARSHVLQQIWQRDLDPGSRALVARIPFEPKTQKQ